MTKPIPDGLHSITPQLAMDGAAEAIEFYKRAFGAVEVMRAPDPSGKKVWHAMLKFGDSMVFVNDHFPEMGGTASPGKLWLYLGEVDAAWKRAVDAGAKIKMPIGDMFWGDRLGTVTDRWGNEFTLAQHMKDLSPAEMQKAQDEAVAQMNSQKK